MGYYPPACKPAGEGPGCDLGERAKAFKMQCLEDTRVTIEREFYRCVKSEMDTAYNISYSGSLSPFGGNELATPFFNFMRAKAKCIRYLAQGKETIGRCYCSRVICTSCWGSPSGVGEAAAPAPDTTTPSLEPVSNSSIPASLPSIRATNSSYDIPIPIIYVRGKVFGNVIWLGNKRQGTFEKQHIAGASVTKTDVNYILVDFALSLGEGPVDAIGRVFLDSVMVLNNLYDPVAGTAVLSPSVFGIDESDQSFNAANPFKMTLYKGTDDQLIPAQMAGEIGGGVAHRGMAFLLIENFPVFKTGAAIPRLQVEVLQNANIEEYPEDVSELNLPDYPFNGVNPNFLHVSHSTGIVTSAGTANGAPVKTGIARTRYSDHLLVDIYNPEDSALILPKEDIDPTTLHISHDGIAIYQTGAQFERRKTYFTDLNSLGRQLVFGVNDNDLSPPSASGLENLRNAFSPIGAMAATATVASATLGVYQVLAAASGANISFTRYDFATGTVSFIHNYVTSGVVVWLRKIEMRKDSSITSGFLALVDNQSTSELSFLFFPNYSALAGFSFDPAAPTLGNVFSSSIWGGGVYSFSSGYHDERDSSMLIFVDGPIKYSVKLSIFEADAPVVTVANYIPTPTNRHLQRSYPFGDVVWVAVETGLTYAYRVSRVSGQLISRKLLSATTSIGGAQYYDPESESVIYTTATGQLSRIFLERVSAKPMLVRDIISDIYRRAEIAMEHTRFVGMDESPLSKGIIITSQATSRGLIEQIDKFYNLFTRESDARLTTSRIGDAEQTVVPVSDLLVTGNNTVRSTVEVMDTNDVTSAHVVYLDEDAEYDARTQIAMRDVVSVTSEYDDFVDRYIKIDVTAPIILNAAEARDIADRLLTAMLQGTRREVVLLGPEYWHLESGDFILIDEGV